MEKIGSVMFNKALNRRSACFENTVASQQDYRYQLLVHAAS